MRGGWILNLMPIMGDPRLSDLLKSDVLLRRSPSPAYKRQDKACHNGAIDHRKRNRFSADPVRLPLPLHAQCDGGPRSGSYDTVVHLPDRNERALFLLLLL